MRRLNPTQYFFLKFGIFIAVILLIDQLGGRLLHACFMREVTGEYAIANHIVYQAKEDLLILGSSRAAHHYNPEILGQSLTMKCYNGGRDGQGMIYYEAMLDLALERHTPRLLILDVNNRDLDNDPEKKDNLSCLLPYLSTSNSVDRFLLQKSSFELLKASMQTYRYNGQLFSIVQHTLFSKFSTPDIAGYRPLTGSMKEGSLPKKARAVQKEEMDAENIRSLENIIVNCRKNNIRLFVFISPRYSLDPTTTTVKKVREICKLRDIDFSDYTSNREFAHWQYFADASHLNDKGADLYSKTAASHILKSDVKDFFKSAKR